MQESSTVSSQLLRRPNKLLSIIVAILVLAAAAGFSVQAISKATAQPTKQSMTSLEKQRMVVDGSIEAYEPLLNDFTREYNLAYTEKFSEDKKAELYKNAKDAFDDEAKLNNQRMAAMASSSAVKNSQIKNKFSNFKTTYEEVVKYYDAQLSSAEAIGSSLNGQCSELPKLNIAKKSYADDFIKAADMCMATLKATQQTSDKETTKLLADFQQIVKRHKGLFSQVLSEKDENRNGKLMIALSSMLEWNSQLKEIQSSYEAAVKIKYSQLAERMNNSSKALKDTISTELNKSGKE